MKNLQFPIYLMTVRLIVRILQSTHASVIYKAALESLNELKPWLSWEKETIQLQDCHEFCEKAIAQWQADQTLTALFFLRSNDTFVGISDLDDFGWALTQYAVGDWVRTCYSAQGLMQEGLATLINHAKNTLKTKKMIIEINDQNSNSCKLAERLGFTHQKTLQKNRNGRPYQARLYLQS